MRILQALQALADHQGNIDWDGAALDRTHSRAHRSATGARTRAAHTDPRHNLDGAWLGQTRGGRTTTLHLCADGHARPLAIVLSEGQRADGTYLLSVLDAIRVPRLGVGRPRTHVPILRVDRAYGARKDRKQLKKRGTRCVCPEREDARPHRLTRGSRGGRPPVCDRELYAGRNVVERLAGRLKDFRAIATRDGKRGRHFYAVVLVACVLLWLPKTLRERQGIFTSSLCLPVLVVPVRQGGAVEARHLVGAAMMGLAGTEAMVADGPVVDTFVQGRGGQQTGPLVLLDPRLSLAEGAEHTRRPAAAEHPHGALKVLHLGHRSKPFCRTEARGQWPGVP